MQLPALHVRYALKPMLSKLRVLPLLLGAALFLLLLAFQQVVAGSVERGESLRRAVSEQAQAGWRCRMLGSAAMREACQAQAPRDGSESVSVLEPAFLAPGSLP